MVDYKNVYVGILKNLCDGYNSVLEILNTIDECDAVIFKLAKDCRQNSEYVVALIEQKDHLIGQIDIESVNLEELHVKLENVMALCPSACYHPLYQNMIDLQKIFYYRLSTLLNKEDVNNPQVVDNLNERKESLELDEMIKEVPPEKRQVFMLVPEKRD